MRTQVSCMPVWRRVPLPESASARHYGGGGANGAAHSADAPSLRGLGGVCDGVRAAVRRSSSAGCRRARCRWTMARCQAGTPWCSGRPPSAAGRRAAGPCLPGTHRVAGRGVHARGLPKPLLSAPGRAPSAACCAWLRWQIYDSLCGGSAAAACFFSESGRAARGRAQRG